eukprot:4654504-Karenia_brevis.AAC.1
MRREIVNHVLISFNAVVSTCEKKGQWQYVAPSFVITECLKTFNGKRGLPPNVISLSRLNTISFGVCVNTRILQFSPLKCSPNVACMKEQIRIACKLITAAPILEWWVNGPGTSGRQMLSCAV